MARKKKRSTSPSLDNAKASDLQDQLETDPAPTLTQSEEAVVDDSDAAAAWTDLDRRFWWAALAVLLVGIAIRQWNLANFPFHPDEAIHAWYAYGFLSYNYDPIYHGPVLYHLLAIVYTIFGIVPFTMAKLTQSGFTGSVLHMGANDFTARLVPSLLGIGLLAMVLWPARRWLGARGSLWCMALLAISPVMVSYQRRLLHDALVMVLTLGAVLCLQATFESPSDTPRGRKARIGLVVLLTLFLATKANAFFIIGMLTAFWILEKVRERFARGQDWRVPVKLPFSDLSVWPPIGLYLIVSVAAVLALRDPETVRVHNERILMIVSAICILMLCLWLLLVPRYQEPDDRTAKSVEDEVDGNEMPYAESGVTRQQYKLRTYIGAGYAAFFVFAFLFGHGFLWINIPAKIRQSPQRWAVNVKKSVIEVASVSWFAARYLPAKLTRQPIALSSPAPTLQNAADWRDITDAVPRMLEYWGGQQKKPRLPGRHDYYIPLMLLYELPIVLAAIGGIIHASRRRTRFTDLLLWWAFTSFVVYAIANEKVPWLLTHIMLPLALLAGVWLGQLKFNRNLTRNIFAGACALGAIFLLRGVSATNFERPADKHEPLFYAQTTEAYHDALFEGLHRTENSSGMIWVHPDKQWPAAWYFRDHSQHLGQSRAAWGTEPPAEPLRMAVHLRSIDWQTKITEGRTTVQNLQKIKERLRTWENKEVEYYIWTRANWPALRPDRFWRFWLLREVEIKHPKDATPEQRQENGILTGGETSTAFAVVSTPQ